jgi:hypothetical protein
LPIEGQNALAAERARKRLALLEATDTELAKIPPLWLLGA